MIETTLPDRRGIYFAFQGLLMSVLVLLLFYGKAISPRAAPSFVALLILFLGSLAMIRLASKEALSSPWMQGGIFLTDTLVAALILQRTGSGADLFLIYLLIIYGSALLRDLAQTFVLTVVASLLYLIPFIFSIRGVVADEKYWLRLLFLWISASLLAILARDSGQAKEDEERKYHERIIQYERLATLGQMAGEVAHRIKAPLTTILVNAEVLRHRLAKSDRSRKELAQIEEEVARCKEILKSLLDLGRIEEMDFSPLDLREPLRASLRSIVPQAERAGLRVEVAKLPSAMTVNGDASLLYQAFLALLQNAVEACKKGGLIRVGTPALRRRHWWQPKEARRFFEITVEDDGAGIAPGDLERVFTPFFTTKGSAGTGLGLSAALRILQKHGGALDAYSDGPGAGARFTLRLPAAERRGRRRG